MAPAPVLVDASGQPLRPRAARDSSCPRCQGTKRVASGGFGTPHPVCAQCGFEWPGEPFIAEESN